MIYHILFANLYEKTISNWSAQSLSPMVGKRIDGQAFLAGTIKESSNDSFIFILTVLNGQSHQFDVWVEKYGLKEYIVFEPPLAIENGVHSENGRNLRLVVMASLDHAWRDMYLDEEDSDVEQEDNPETEEKAI